MKTSFMFFPKVITVLNLICYSTVKRTVFICFLTKGSLANQTYPSCAPVLTPIQEGFGRLVLKA